MEESKRKKIFTITAHDFLRDCGKISQNVVFKFEFKNKNDAITYFKSHFVGFSSEVFSRWYDLTNPNGKKICSSSEICLKGILLKQEYVWHKGVQI